MAPESYPTLAPNAARLAQAVQQLARFVDADSTSGREEPGVALALELASELGLPARRLPAAPGRDNVLIGPETARIVLCTHLDTVPPFIPSRVEDDTLWGRGACDAKGVAIAMLHAVDTVLRLDPRHAPSVACLLVVGEETDHLGAKAIVGNATLQPTHILLGEPCGMTPAIGQKGLLKIQVEALGKSGHSAYPEVGVSAIHALVRALHALLEAELPGDPSLGNTTLNIGEIHGGLAPNVIAPAARATLLARCAAPVDAVLAAIRAALGPTLQVTELSRSEPIDFFTLDHPPAEAVPFNTDASILLELGAKVALLGPGDMRCAHSEREHLRFSALAEGISRYAEAIMRLL